MEDTWRILESFLEKFRDEVLARSGDNPDDLPEQLRAFAQGQTSPADRAALAELLKEHPEWVKRLAEQIKSRRPSHDSSTP